jgi:hypothetical protein
MKVPGREPIPHVKLDRNRKGNAIEASRLPTRQIIYTER